MSELDEFKAVSKRECDAKQWAAKYRKPYAGGGGGVGKVHAVSLHKAEAVTIYFQEYDGSRNYHCAPADFVPYLERAIAAHFETVLASALQMLAGDRESAAKKALAEYQRLLSAAGVDLAGEVKS